MNIRYIPNTQKRRLRGRLWAIVRHYGLEEANIVEALQKINRTGADGVAKLSVCPMSHSTPRARRDSGQDSCESFVNFTHKVCITVLTLLLIVFHLQAPTLQEPQHNRPEPALAPLRVVIETPGRYHRHKMVDSRGLPRRMAPRSPSQLGMVQVA